MAAGSSQAGCSTPDLGELASLANRTWPSLEDRMPSRSGLRSGRTAPARSRLGLAARYGSCHTAVIDGYVVEGHVPAADVQRLLKEKPKAVGIAVPSMPPGSPGMESAKPVPYNTLLVQAGGEATVFAKH